MILLSILVHIVVATGVVIGLASLTSCVFKS